MFHSLRWRALLAAALPAAIAAFGLPSAAQAASVSGSQSSIQVFDRGMLVGGHPFEDNDVIVTADAGRVRLVRPATRLEAEGRDVGARLAVRLDAALAGERLKVEVEATDRRGRRQLERNAGTIEVKS